MRTLMGGLVMVLAVISGPVLSSDDEVTECDRLAAHGSDPERIAPGVSQSGMAKAAAIAACIAALEIAPDNRRLQYQLGRAYFYSGRTDDAMPHLVKSAEAGHMQAQFVLGYIYDGGLQGVEQDRCQAADLWLASARQGRLASMISYPHHVVRGLFDGCDIEASNDEMAGFLIEAKGMTSDYYRQMLIQDVTDDFQAFVEKD